MISLARLSAIRVPKAAALLPVVARFVEARSTR
jgi:hypothetical protein